MGGHLGRIKALVRKTGYSTQAMSLLFGLEVSDAGYKALLHCSVGRGGQGELIGHSTQGPRSFRGQ